jgi:plastocyanin
MSPRPRFDSMRTALAIAAALCGTLAQAATLQVTVLARDGQPLADAVVLLEPAAGAAPKAPAPITATVQQQKMQFLPAVSVVPVGSKLKFSNLDGWEHHVRGGPAGLAAFSASGKAGFELRLDGREDGKPPASAEVTVGQAGPIQLGCHIHGSMRGYVYVTDSPWAVKTGPDGVAVLPDVPEGGARLRIWHPEQLVEAAATPVTITQVTALNLPTQVQPRKRRP